MKLLLTVSNNDNNHPYNIIISDIKGEEIINNRKVGEYSGEDCPVWLSNNKIAFTEHEGVFVIELITEQKKLVMKEEIKIGSYYGFIDWGCYVYQTITCSPDGRKLIVCVNPEPSNASSTTWDLWLVDTNGANLKQLTQGPYSKGDRDPCWASK